MAAAEERRQGKVDKLMQFVFRAVDGASASATPVGAMRDRVRLYKSRSRRRGNHLDERLQPTRERWTRLLMSTRRRLASFSLVGVLVLLPALVVGVAAASADYVVTVHPAYRPAFAGQGSRVAIPPPSVCVELAGFACYTPALMRTAYDIPASLTGAGETIVIVDAFGSPTIRNDLAVFDEEFGLPDSVLNIFYPDGAPTFNARSADENAWAFETGLDVEWAHAIAPAATIDLVIAATAHGEVLKNAEAYAVAHHLGQVMSLSFAAPEAVINGNDIQQSQAHQIYVDAAQEGMTVFASAGDLGASNSYPTANANYPASDPLVTGVGGTTLFMADDGTYGGETVWNDLDACPYGCTGGLFGATGGAPSVLFPAPPWQTGPTRKVADVAYNASAYTGIITYQTFPGLPDGGGFFFTGGTSEGAPQWAGILALADQAAGRPLGYINPTLYAIAANPTEYATDFHDITTGDNAYFGPGYTAGPGYDYPTGLGSPNVANLISTLIDRG